MLTANQRQRIADPQLQKYLTYIACRIHQDYADHVSTDDVVSAMNAHIVEQANRDPAFLDQTPGYITKAAAWAARDYCRRERHGRALQPQLLDREDDDGTIAAEPSPISTCRSTSALPWPPSAKSASASRRCAGAGFQRVE